MTWYSEVMESMPATSSRQEVKKPHATQMIVHWDFFLLMDCLRCLSHCDTVLASVQGSGGSNTDMDH